MDLNKRLDYTKELTRDFVFTYTSVFKVEPTYVIIDYNNTSFEDIYTSMKSKKGMTLYAPTHWSYYYRSYCAAQKKEQALINDQASLVHSTYTPVIIDRADPSKIIGFFNVDVMPMPYDLCLYNIWLQTEDEEDIPLTELYRILFTYSRQWYRKLNSDANYSIRLPWPDDEYMQGSTFHMQVAKVADAVPDTKVISTKMVKTSWEASPNVDRFVDTGYKVLECLPNDIFNSLTLMKYFHQLLRKENISKTFPTSSLITRLLPYLTYKEDTGYKDFKSAFWHYVYPKTTHLLIFMEDDAVIGHLEYMDTNDHSISISSYVFLYDAIEKQYSKNVMEAFLYDCQQGSIEVISVMVNSDSLRKYFESFNFKVAEVELMAPLPE